MAFLLLKVRLFNKIIAETFLLSVGLVILSLYRLLFSLLL